MSAAIPNLACLILAAQVYHLPPRVLPSIRVVEGGAAGMVRPDENGTADLGIMQVNTVWLPTLAARATLTPAETRRRLVDDPCFGIAAAALILRTLLDRDGGDLMMAVGDYHSRTPRLHDAYLARVIAAARALFGRVGNGNPGFPAASRN